MSRDIDILSLLKYCLKCGSKCCKESSPILTRRECYRIIKKTKKDYFYKIGFREENYYIIGNNSNGSLRDTNKDPCPFLNNAGKCNIQNIKPLDCRAYPFRVVVDQKGTLNWHVHSGFCPAVGYLDIDFINTAKNIAIQSANRFSPLCYKDWIKKYSSWTLCYDTRLKSDPILRKEFLGRLL